MAHSCVTTFSDAHNVCRTGTVPCSINGTTLSAPFVPNLSASRTVAERRDSELFAASRHVITFLHPTNHDSLFLELSRTTWLAWSSIQTSDRRASELMR